MVGFKVREGQMSRLGLAEFLYYLSEDERKVYECIVRDERVHSLDEFWEVMTMQFGHTNEGGLMDKLLPCEAYGFEFHQAVLYLQNIVLKYVYTVEPHEALFTFYLNNYDKTYSVTLNMKPGGVLYDGDRGVQPIRNGGLYNIKFEHTNIEESIYGVSINFMDRSLGVMDMSLGNGFKFYNLDLADVKLRKFVFRGRLYDVFYPFHNIKFTEGYNSTWGEIHEQLRQIRQSVVRLRAEPAQGNAGFWDDLGF